ncbi:MAG: hypothetical protein M0Q94_09535, partial [Candidatus Cloacimonetes bacterium]|nr:hypothetical protein [Candidatus Cloacimonadota bacterium]
MILHLLEDIKEVLNKIIDESDLPSELKFNNSNVLILKQNEKSITLYFVDKIIFNINFKPKKIVFEFRPEYANIYKIQQKRIYYA